MGEPSRRQLLGYLAAGVVVVVLGALWIRGGGGAPPAAVSTVSVAEPAGAGGDGGRAATIVVHIAGAVRRPGVYRVPDGTRVAEAIDRAGGPKGRADLDALNLAAKLGDGRQVLVPARVRAAPGAPPGAAPAGPAEGLPVNLNSATLEELDTLEGVGPATAQAILDYREEHGSFGSIDELDQVPGIGPATVATLRDAVTL